MTSRAITLTQARIARDAAKMAFQTRLEQVKTDLAARSVGGRVADRLGEEAVDALDYAADVAKDSKGIIAGTLAAIVLWLFRNPIIAWAERLFTDDTGEEEDSDYDHRSKD